eukprot:gene5190-5715_t
MGSSASTSSVRSSIASTSLSISIHEGSPKEKANWYFQHGNYIQAEEYLLVALEESKALYGEDNIETMAILDQLGLVYSKQGHAEEAERLHQQVYEQYEHLLGSKHPMALQAQHHLALARFQRRQYNDAAKLFLSCYYGRMAILGSSHLETLTSMQYLAMAYLEEGQYTTAEEVLRQCLSKQRFLLGPDHHMVVTLSMLLCRAYEGLRRYKEAVNLCKSIQQVIDLPSTGSSNDKNRRFERKVKKNQPQSPTSKQVQQELLETQAECQRYLKHLEDLAALAMEEEQEMTFSQLPDLPSDKTQLCN